MYEPPLRGRPLIGRRSLLRLVGVAALGAVAGCRSGQQRTAPATPSPSTTPPGPSPRPATASTPPTIVSASPKPMVSPLSPDELVAQRLAVAEQLLIAAYDATAVAHPELAGRLAPFRADHLAHLQGLVPGSLPNASPYPTDTPLLSAPTTAEIFQSLANLERTAAAARLGDVATTSGSLARVIASIGGCEAAHAALLSVAT